MKRCLFTYGILMLSLSFQTALAQAPRIRSQKSVSTNAGSYEPEMFGNGLTNSVPKVHLRANNGNTITAGSGFSGYPSATISELDVNNNIVWTKHYTRPVYKSVSYFDVLLRSLQPGIDSGYIMTATPRMTSASTDYAWVVRMKRNGDSAWHRFYGGSGNDEGNYICRVQNKGYILIGTSTSTDGTLAGVRTADTATQGRVWICRIDLAGTPIWSKCFGFPSGTSDRGIIIKPTNDGGFICGANMQSKDYAAPQYHGGRDIWLAKLDSLGNIQWARYYGGSANELLGDVEQTADGGFVFVGSTGSNNGDVSGFHGSTGQTDAWVVKINSDGSINWQKCIGGSANDHLADIIQTQDNGFVATGGTASTDGDITTTFAIDNILLTKLSMSGTLQWTKVFGGSLWEFGRNVLQVGENDYVINGVTYSSNGDMTGFTIPPSSGINWFAYLGNTSTIKGSAYYDWNGNSTKDANENWAGNMIVTAANQNGYQRSGVLKNGMFKLEVDTGAYSTFVNSSVPYFTVSPANATTSFASYFLSDSIGFRLVPIPNKQDLAINLIPLTAARPGFSASYKINYRNIGTTVISSGTISFTKDSRTTLLMTTPTVGTVSGDTLRWNYTNLNPGDSSSIIVSLHVQPANVNINDTLSYMVMIDPAALDETPLNDTSILRQRVTGSFDPNDKLENNAGIIPLSFINEGSYLQYTIRFQNTGTDTAFNVVVRDTLSNRLELGTIEMITTSHPYDITIEDGGRLAWRFNNILLPDSNRNEPASHGYIVYRIRPKSDVVVGEIIPNTASIYFDFNLPVITNDATTLVQSELVVLPQELLSFYGHQQNMDISLHWRAASRPDIKSYEIERSLDGNQFKQVGTKLNKDGTTDYAFADNIAALSASSVFYRLKIIKQAGYSYSAVLLFRKGNQLVKELNIYPNPVEQQASVTFTSSLTAAGKLQMLNITGAVISTQYLNVQKGKNVYSLQMAPAMKPGVYLVKMIIGNETSSALFITH